MIQEGHLPSLYISQAARAQAVTHSSAQEYMRICTAYSMEQGLSLIHIFHAAKEAGADAIKLQTFTPDTITLDCDDPCFQITQGTIWDGTTLYKLYQEAYTPWDWQPKLMEEANRLGLECFSSPFDFTSVDFMESMNMPAYKVACLLYTSRCV